MGENTINDILDIVINAIDPDVVAVSIISLNMRTSSSFKVSSVVI